MSVSWTPAQQDAITARGGAVLVSAAAGSGKTAVLVQRAIELLTAPENPISADKLLIVTFTRAAAAEMRARLEKRLYDMLRADPHNEALRRQSLLLSQANIGTMHSFCANTLREFFHVLGIAQDFKIITDKQESELKNAALGEALDAAFDTPRYEVLADAFTGERDDRKLFEIILQLYSYMHSHPNPEAWLQEKVAMYRHQESAAHSPWGIVIFDEARAAVAFSRSLIKEALTIAQEDDALFQSFLPVLSDEQQLFDSLSKALSLHRWDAAKAAVDNITFGRLLAPKGYKDDPLKLRIAAMREQWKTIALKTLPALFSAKESDILADFEAIGDITQNLADLTLQFDARYREKKQERNFLDYGDLEHFMIQLLRRPDGTPTPAALTLSARFDEIMIDEYQDINEVQDWIFTALSRNRKNLFMVGDVKQSIYGFRQAMPDIFIRYRDQSLPYDGTSPVFPARISLDRNFRSRNTVTDSVNFIFSQLMNRETGDIDYEAGEQLVCGASYPPRTDCATALCFIRQPAGASIEDTEGTWIAEKIHAMVSSGFTVQDGERTRPARYGDFCILLRSANTHAHGYAAALHRFGIPAKASIPGGFFATREIRLMLSLLRCIDNPNQDIPLLAVLASPIYGFSPDDLALLRADNKDAALYLALTTSADPRCAAFLQDLTHYRAVSATMPADLFLLYLYQKTGYVDMVLAMEAGAQRLQNLYLLHQHAKEFEQTGTHGLSRFVHFIDRLQAAGTDLPTAQRPEDGSDQVQIMSIHKSKGLEFPVCILAGCARGKGNQREEVLLHPTLGLGIRLAQHHRGIRYNTMPREAIALDRSRREAAEELRILYVALTRAREKLFLVSAEKRMETALQKQSIHLTGSGLPVYSIRHAASFSQWLQLCALRHPDGDGLREIAGISHPDIVPCQTPWSIGIYDCPDGQQASSQQPVIEALPDPALLRTLQRRTSYVYPYEDSTDLPTKVTASALTAKATDVPRILARPAWLYEKKMTPAQRGTALHDYMQYADFGRALADPQGELQRLIDRHFLTPAQGDAVDLQKVLAFLHSDLGQRVLASPDVQKERRFTVEIPAGESFSGLQGAAADAPIILQGSVDCTFVEGDRISIIDFKTDQGKSLPELLAHYALQLRLYALAMTQVTGLALGTCCLYATRYGQSIDLSALSDPESS